MSLTWTQESTTSLIAQQLRRDIRAHRRTGGREGHRFVYKDLREVWTARTALQSVAFVVVTHWAQEDWQIWAWHVQDGWLLVGWHEDLNEAVLLAENHRWPEQDADMPLVPVESGTYVLAGWKDTDTPPNIRVHCQTKNTAIAISEIFHRLGCSTMREDVP